MVVTINECLTYGYEYMTQLMNKISGKGLGKVI